MLKLKEQLQIQEYIESISEEEMHSVLEEKLLILEGHKLISLQGRAFNKAEKADYNTAIETVVRIEALVKNKGALFRSKRRFQLVMASS